MQKILFKVHAETIILVFSLSIHKKYFCLHEPSGYAESSQNRRLHILSDFDHRGKAVSNTLCGDVESYIFHSFSHSVEKEGKVWAQESSVLFSLSGSMYSFWLHFHHILHFHP